MRATAKAHANIALIKYWGKRDLEHNLPATSSLSLTLQALYSVTQVTFDARSNADQVELNGQIDNCTCEKIQPLLNWIRRRVSKSFFALIKSQNNFPTRAGLASSASGMAALALAATQAAQLKLTDKEMSQLARLGSGSAARSIFGGFVEMHKGKQSDGSDCYAEPLYAADHWPLEFVIVVTSKNEKAIASTTGMEQSRISSPFYDPWLGTSDKDIAAARQAIHDRDLTQLGTIMEHNCLKMHAVALSTKPALVYWNASTLNLIHEVHAIRKKGFEAYFTIDAGPQVKVLCAPEQAASVEAHLSHMQGVKNIIRSDIGPGVQLIKDVF